MTDTWLPDPSSTPPMPPVKAPRRDAPAAASRDGHIVFSPAQARALAKILLRKADECTS